MEQNMMRYPFAEDFAQRVTLSTVVVAEPVALELYGVTNFVPDRTALLNALLRAQEARSNIPTGCGRACIGELDAAESVIESRLERIG